MSLINTLKYYTTEKLFAEDLWVKHDFSLVSKHVYFVESCKNKTKWTKKTFQWWEVELLDDAVYAIHKNIQVVNVFSCSASAGHALFHQAFHFAPQATSASHLSWSPFPEQDSSLHLPRRGFLSWQRSTVLTSNSKIQTFSKSNLCLSSRHQSPTWGFLYSSFISLSMNNHTIHCTKY